MSNALDEGPFFHGTKADLSIGDLLVAGYRSNYRPEIVMNHIYFTALQDGAGLAAGDGAPRVYEVDPTGEFENDPNVTDKKFPGNPTRSSTKPNEDKPASTQPKWLFGPFFLGYVLSWPAAPRIESVSIVGTWIHPVCNSPQRSRPSSPSSPPSPCPS